MRLALAAALAALALLAGCGDGKNAAEGIVFEDPKGAIDVETGMTFTIELSVNASVGYDWRAAALPAGAPVELKDTRVHYDNPDSIGDSGVKRFVYEAKRPGRQAILLRRSFRGDPQERRTVTVTIRG